jgi:hypothetical protein
MTTPAALELCLIEQVGGLPSIPDPFANMHVGFEGSTLREAEYDPVVKNVLVRQFVEEEEVQQRTP